MEYYPLWLKKDIQLIDHSLWEQKHEISRNKVNPIKIEHYSRYEWIHTCCLISDTHDLCLISLFFSFIETFFTRSIDSKHTQRLKDWKCSCTQCPSCFHLQSLPLLFLAGPCVLWPFVRQSSDVVCYINPRLPSDDIKAHPASIQL